MKKIISLLLTAAMALSMASCGEKTAPWESTEPSAYIQETTPPEPSAQPQQPTTEPPARTEAAPEETRLLPPQPEPEEDAFVPVGAYIPGLMTQLKYATDDNFTHRVIYDFSDAYLRYGTVKKLLAAQLRLEEMGLGLLLWDGFRPVSAQFTLWEACPDPRYVANPRTGFSSHSRGNTVDLTLVDATGNMLIMPTGFDDFSALADRDYSDCPEEAAKNALLLQSVMEEAGFTGYYGEWWHFTDTVSYAVEERFQPLPQENRLPNCREFITLRTAADVTSREITRITPEEEFTVLARCGDFFYIDYRGLFGYVLADYTQPIS